jgi:YfiH family protein
MASILSSTLLTSHGFRHAFTLRTGSAPSAPPESLRSLRRRAAEVLGCAPDRLYEATQVHGAAVETVARRQSRDTVLAQQADALVANEPLAAVGVRVADCLPLLLADPVTGSVAAVHVGWRGAEAGVVRAALDALLRLPGVAAKNLLAAIFPHIRACCFEVDDDVAARLQAVCVDTPVVSRPDAKKPHVELAALVRAQLRSGGVAGERVDDVAGCTRCDPIRFFSYRRQGDKAGRHLAAIAARER